MKEPVAHGSFRQFPSSCQANFEQRFETSQKLKCDLDVFPSAGVKPFNRLPEKNTHYMAKWKEPFKGQRLMGEQLLFSAVSFGFDHIFYVFIR